MENIKLEIKELKFLLELILNRLKQIESQNDGNSKNLNNAQLLLEKNDAERLLKKIEEKLEI
jgi:hypothetical protein